MRKYALMSAALAMLTVPAFAGAEFYVSQSAATKKCEVTQIKPDGKTMMMVGKAGFTTKADAQTAMKADSKICK